MKIKELIKSVPFMKAIGKKYYIYSQFRDDAKSFSKYYCESAENKGDYRYSIMLIVHSLEKGMCMQNPRPFGKDKASKLLELLKKSKNKKSFEYNLGISALNKWVDFYKERNWDIDSLVETCSRFLEDENITLDAGYKIYTPSVFADQKEFEYIIMSRHSVRDFKKQKLSDEDIDFAVKCFIETPTACNRQMCRLIFVEDKDKKDFLDKVIVGLPGFNKNNIQYFVVTYDLAAFAYSGERQQGMFNAGLCTMNFVNGLHVKGIGSCCLQWSNKKNEDIQTRKKLGLKESERIAVVIAAGYYLDKNIIPCSTRKSKNEVYIKV